MKAKKKQTKNVNAVDTVNQDFKRALIIVSFAANLVVFVTWLTIEVTDLYS